MIYTFWSRAKSQNLMQALYLRNANIAQQFPPNYYVQQPVSQKGPYKNQINNTEENFIEEPMLK
jgi:hypothetical protein